MPRNCGETPLPGAPHANEAPRRTAPGHAAPQDRPLLHAPRRAGASRERPEWGWAASRWTLRQCAGGEARANGPASAAAGNSRLSRAGPIAADTRAHLTFAARPCVATVGNGSENMPREIISGRLAFHRSQYYVSASRTKVIVVFFLS